jgi:hypothetical protein
LRTGGACFFTSFFWCNNIAVLLLAPNEKNNEAYKTHKETFRHGGLMIVLYVTRYSGSRRKAGPFLLYHLYNKTDKAGAARINWLLKTQL